MITRYGFDVYFTVVTLCIVASVLAVLFIEPKIFRYLIYGVSAFSFLFATNFFRYRTGRLLKATISSSHRRTEK